MEKKKETKRFDLMEFGSALGREEMRKLMAGSSGGGECLYCLASECSCTGCEPEDELSSCWYRESSVPDPTQECKVIYPSCEFVFGHYYECGSSCNT